MTTLRFAPSPTGKLHVGNLRTALMNWLYTRKTSGKFILRIDDTDVERSSLENEEAIKDDLLWLGLHWDESFRQSDRLRLYESAKEELILSGRLYPCYETTEDLALKKKSLLQRGLPPVYDRSSLFLSQSQKQHLESIGIKPHFRFLLQGEHTAWEDSIRGKMQVDIKSLSDPVVVRSDGSLTYHLASVVDDIECNITNIVRGEDHLSNSAIHIQLFQALGAKTTPDFAHLSLLYNKAGEISKRIGGFEIESLRREGIDRMAVNSFFARIGTSNPVYFSYAMSELIEEFTFEKCSKSSVHYDMSDLQGLNAKLIRHMPYDLALPRLKEINAETVDAEFWIACQGNLTVLKDIREWYRICKTEIEPVILDAKLTDCAASLLPKGSWDKNTFKIWIAALKTQTSANGPQLFEPLRLALTGLREGPELRFLLPLIGFNKAYSRLIGKRH